MSDQRNDTNSVYLKKHNASVSFVVHGESVSIQIFNNDHNVATRGLVTLKLSQGGDRCPVMTVRPYSVSSYCNGRVIGVTEMCDSLSKLFTLAGRLSKEFSESVFITDRFRLSICAINHSIARKKSRQRNSGTDVKLPVIKAA